MLSSISPQVMQRLENFVRVAQVEKVENHQQILLNLSEGNRVLKFWASFAMGNMPLPQPGDKVLVAGEDQENGFIIGHFPTTPANGIRFSIEEDADSGKTILKVPEGDLDLSCAKGSINLDAGKGIKLNSQEFSMDTAKGAFNVTEGSYQGLRFSATLAQSKLFLGKLNSTVGRLIEKAKNVYRQVDSLNQLKAGRMRTLVSGSYHLKGENINQKAEKDVRIDGDKINLG